MYTRKNHDPILMRLSSGTVTALAKSNICCLEDLIRLEESDIKKLPGIGRKRCREIMEFLYRLPFDYTASESPPSNPEQDPKAGVHPAVQNYLAGYWYNDKYYHRGKTYFLNGAVSQVELKDETRQKYEAKVFGTRQYTVTLELKSETKLQAQCTCPAYTQWNYGSAGCKHIIASILKLAEQQRLARFHHEKVDNQSLRLLLHSLKAVKSGGKQRTPQALEYLLVQKEGEWDLYPKHIYPLLNINTRYARRNINPWEELKPADPTDRLILTYLRQMYLPSHHYPPRKNSNSLGDVLHLLREKPLYIKREKASSERIHFQDDPFEVVLHVGREHSDPKVTEKNTQGNLVLQFRLQNDTITKSLNEVEVLYADPCWVLYDTTVAQVGGSELARRFFLSASRDTITIQPDDLETFFQDIYPALQEGNIPIHLEANLTVEHTVTPTPRLYLRETSNRLLLSLRVAYDDCEIRHENQPEQLVLPNTATSRPNESPLMMVQRDLEQEHRWIEALKQTGLKSLDGFRTFTPEQTPLDWVIEQVPSLAKAEFEIYGQKQLKRYAPPKSLTSGSFRVSSGENWFDVEGTLDFEGEPVSLGDIHRVLIHDKPYVRLRDGSTGELPEDWLTRLKGMLHLFNPDKRRVRVPRIAAPMLEDLGEVSDDFHSDDSFQKYSERLRQFDRIEEVDPPGGFRGELRKYQQAGLSWLYFLYQYEFGGILADDMGLGKTIQVLALLQKVREETGGEPASLIVAPRSVIHNWQLETERFLPIDSIYIHHGPDRVQTPEKWPEANLAVTTYGTLRNDIPFLKEQHFDFVVLDESHTIRNPASRTFQAVRQLQATHRFCLTGTPVQNTTMDLWPQFEFLNPGILGGQRQFRDRWVKPLESQRNGSVERTLHRLVAPFILRRTKQKVAADLPPLTESLIECPMDHQQQNIYEKYRKVYRKVITNEINEKGVRESRFTVLEGLTRLRQICCSPNLLDNEKGSSAKLRRFTEVISELHQEGHRALVFSQFVGFLREIETEVRRQGWGYEYLDGQTRDRQQRIHRFQEDGSVSLFLISLKAGGEGLNLTGADYVLLMDPWWNPAAEKQAMDRTHRIGQSEHVFVYRFICPATVEEKILRLQQRKRDLAEKLIAAEPGIFKQLDRDDLLALFE